MCPLHRSQSGFYKTQFASCYSLVQIPSMADHDTSHHIRPLGCALQCLQELASFLYLISPCSHWLMLVHPPGTMETMDVEPVDADSRLYLIPESQFTEVKSPGLPESGSVTDDQQRYRSASSSPEPLGWVLGFRMFWTSERQCDCTYNFFTKHSKQGPRQHPLIKNSISAAKYMNIRTKWHRQNL